MIRRTVRRERPARIESRRPLLNCSSGSGRHLIFIAVAIDQSFLWNVERNESALEQEILDGSLA